MSFLCKAGPCSPGEAVLDGGKKGTKAGAARPTFLWAEQGAFAHGMLGGCLPGLSHPKSEWEGSCPGPKHWQSPRESGRALKQAVSCLQHPCWLLSPTKARVPPHFSRFAWAAVGERDGPVSAPGALGGVCLATR